MKRKLITSLLISGLCTSLHAQFNQSNEPENGDNIAMFVCDSNASSFATANGSGQVWNYSALTNYAGLTKTVSCIPTTTTPYLADFPISTRVIEIPGLLSRFIRSTPASLTSQGFVFTDPTFGQLLVKLDVNEQYVMFYPFDLADVTTDPIEGTVSGGIIPSPTPTIGTSVSTFDGSGTLTVGTNSLANTNRIKSVLTLSTDLGILGTADLVITQYDYYNAATSNLPVFIHATISFEFAGGMPNEQALVLSFLEPSTVIGVSELNQVNFDMFPNPTDQSVSLLGLTPNSIVKVFDLSGKMVHTSTASSEVTTINRNELFSGIYVVQVSSENGIGVQKLIVY